MLNNVSVIIPISLNNPSREKNFQWVEKFYKTTMPEVELCIGVCNDKAFSKGKAINDAVEKSKGEILVIADADIFYDPVVLKESIKQLDTAAWVIPFKRVLNITQKSTMELLETEPDWPISIELETWKRRGAANGGINIVPRKHFETVGGFDERFLGWGGEDDAFAYSLNQLCGRRKRMDFTLYHLWHKRGGFAHYKQNKELLRKYNSGKQSILNEIETRKKLKEKSSRGSLFNGFGRKHLKWIKKEN